MPDKRTRRCSTPLASGTCKPIGMARMRAGGSTECWRCCRVTRSLLPCGGMSAGQPPWRTAWQFPTKFNTHLRWDPALVLLGTAMKEMKTYVYTKTCPYMFIAAFFLKAPNCKQPRGPSPCGWLDKLWHIHAMKSYSAVKRNQLLP